MTRRVVLCAGLVVLALLLGGQEILGWRGRSATQSVSAQGTGSPGFGTAAFGAAPREKGSPVATNPPARGTAGKPAGTATNRGKLLATLGVKRVTTSGGVALTFDDGPHPVWTAQVLALLRAQRVRAMFCLVGTEVVRYPGLVRQIVREGHALCNHSWHHELNLGTRPVAEIRANLARTNAAIRLAAPGARVRYFRHPGGLWTRPAVKVTRELGMIPLDWTVDPNDWDDATAAQIQARVLANARAGSVILLHDGGGDRVNTVTACRTLIPALKSRFRVLPVR